MQYHLIMMMLAEYSSS